MRPKAWVELFRPPNFLTVPGDLLAGWLLAAGAGGARLDSGLVLILGASFCFYGGGLLLNDWADAEEDRRERPQRPVPSGRVRRGSVLAGGSLLLLAGGALCATQGRAVLLIGLALAAGVTIYNLLGKRVWLVGPLNMGFCRSLNLLLGAAWQAGMSFSPLVIWGAVTVGLYITAVTHLARTETVARYGLLVRWLPAGVLAAGFVVYPPLSPLVEKPGQLLVLGIWAATIWRAASAACLLPDRTGRSAVGAPPVPALIGRLIGLLIPLQAAFIVGSGDGDRRLALGLALLALWPMKAWVRRFFYSS